MAFAAAGAGDSVPLPAPVRQQSGGPLSLSLRNEVDAAIARGRRGLIAQIRSFDPAGLDVPTVIYANLALLDAEGREAAGARAFLNRAVSVSGREDSAPHPLRAGIAALRSPSTGEPAPVDTLRRAITPLARAITAAAPGGARDHERMAALQLLLDTGLALNIPLEEIIDHDSRAYLERYLRASAPPHRFSNEFPGIRATGAIITPLLLETTLAAALPDDGRFNSAAEWLSLHVLAPAAPMENEPDGVLLWSLARLFNRIAPPPPGGSGTGIAPDWRRILARGLLGSQVVDPADGAGYWRHGVDSGAAAIRRNALNLLVLMSL